MTAYDMPSRNGSIRIGTRGSALALIQAELVRAAFRETGRASTIVVVETAGDLRGQDLAWGEGAFVAAIERYLLAGDIDVAVHSAKDLPTEEDARLRIGAYLPRADPRDAVVLPRTSTAHGLADLPDEARVGTDSPRRTQFLRALRPGLRFHPLHGNVDTRLRRLDQGETDALVLACAGLDRLGRSDRIAERLDPELVPPAPGQGAIAVQVRADDAALADRCRTIDHRPTRVAVEAERAFLRATGGGCRAPFGALATIRGDVIELLGAHAPDRSAPAFGRCSGNVSKPAAVGRRLAVELGLVDVGSRSRANVLARPRVLVTRASGQQAALVGALEAAGLEPMSIPAIRIDLASSSATANLAGGLLHTVNWVVITSPNAARAMLEAAERVLSDLGVPRWAAVGTSTREVLEREGIEVTFMPSEATSEALAAELPVASGEVILVLRGDLADGSMARTLRRRGATVEEAIVYRTVEAPRESRGLVRDAFEGGRIEAIVFTSGSTVRGIVALATTDGVDVGSVPAVCIGEATAGAARRAGFDVLAIAETPDPISIAETVASALRLRPRDPTHLQETP